MSFWPENIWPENIYFHLSIIGMVLVSIVNEYDLFIFLFIYIYIVSLIKSVSYLQGDACKKTNVNGWMLGKCCLFGVSDLFLTCFWPFPESSSTSKKSARAMKLGTILVMVTVISLVVPAILVLVLLLLLLVVVVVVEVVVVVVAVEVVVVVVVVVEEEVAMIRAEVDGWMDARQVLPFWCFWPVSDLFLTSPGVFFNFKKKSTSSQTRNTVSNNSQQSK